MGTGRRTVTPLPPAPNVETLHPLLLGWYARHRRDLPWRRRPDPYAVLVSEFMLQQTQVERVAPRFRSFLARFPSLAALARASTGDVLREWSGLGYNVRALRLQQIAREAMERHGGTLPATVEQLRQFRGIGPYTAAAIACFAYGQPVVTVDTNVRRVLGRVCHGVEAELTAAAAERLAATLLPAERAADWNQALMDLGATICTARAPLCLSCPLQAHCRARADHLTTGIPIGSATSRREHPKPHVRPFAGSSRFYRGRIVQALTQLAPGQALPLASLGSRVKEDFSTYDAQWLADVVTGLERDGLVTLHRHKGAELVTLPGACSGTPTGETGGEVER